MDYIILLNKEKDVGPSKQLRFSGKQITSDKLLEDILAL